MDLELKGKAAIVTGGNRGIGKAIARQLAREGVNVAIIARDKAALAAAAADIGARDQHQGPAYQRRHRRRCRGEEGRCRRGRRLRPHRHPRQLRRAAGRAGQAAGARRDHQRALLGRHERQGDGLPAHRARGGAAHDQAEVGPHHQRQRAGRAQHRHHHRLHAQRRRRRADQEPRRRALAPRHRRHLRPPRPDAHREDAGRGGGAGQGARRAAKPRSRSAWPAATSPRG